MHIGRLSEFVAVALKGHRSHHAIAGEGASECIRVVGPCAVLSPSGSYNFSRTYANGAGHAIGSGQLSGEQAYGFGRIGGLVNVTLADEFAPSRVWPPVAA
jgi:hypothetical protein